MTTTFQRIHLSRWRQFSEADIPLHQPFTVLTGPNGCGKTTVLNILSRHFGWEINLVATPYLSKRMRRRLWTDFGERWTEEISLSPPTAPAVGQIEYSTGEICTLHIPEGAEKKPSYALTLKNKRPVTGLHVPSHRPAINYQAIRSIPTDPKSSQKHYEEFRQLLLQAYNSDKANNPGLVLKQSLVSLAVFGPGNRSVAPNPEYEELFEGFQEVLRTVLPHELGFERLEIRMPDIVLVTRTGTFSLDAMSGGINSLFGIVWQIYMFGAEKGESTVVFDEPENHLHPSMQRTLLPSLSRAFPAHRFVVATHSPFIVTSHPSATVVALTFDDDSRIRSHVLDQIDLAGSANTVLREILAVPTTLPLWVEERIKEILDRYQTASDDQDRAKRIFDELRSQGLNSALGYLHPDDEE